MIQVFRPASLALLFSAGLLATAVVAQQPPSQQPQQPQAPQPAPAPGTPAKPAPGQPPPGEQAAAPGQKPPAPAAPAQAAPAGPTKPLVPMAASSLLRNPDPLYGEYVSLTATVEQSLSQTVFTVDQDKTKATGKDVLILAPRLNKPVTPNTYVVVLGEVVKFDPAEIGAKYKGFGPELKPDAAAQFAGRPAILATAVLTESSENLAMRLPPPMSKEETVLAEAMKKVGSSNGALRKALEGTNVELAREHAGILRTSFNTAESFMKSQRKEDAVKWAQDAERMAETIDKAAAAGKWDEVKTVAGEMGKMCATCHTAYRERFDDGSFRFNPNMKQGG